MSEEKEMDKKAMKQLRAERKEFIERARQAIKVQNQDIKKIKEQLKTGPKTVPEIAEAVQMPSVQVLRYVAGLRKYGIVAEGPKEGDYFKYELAG